MISSLVEKYLKMLGFDREPFNNHHHSGKRNPDIWSRKLGLNIADYSTPKASVDRLLSVNKIKPCLTVPTPDHGLGPVAQPLCSRASSSYLFELKGRVSLLSPEAPNFLSLSGHLAH